MNREMLLAEIQRLGPWQHEIDLGDGISTRGVVAPRDSDTKFHEFYSPELVMRRLIGNLYPNGLEGRSLLDCACNSGAYSLAATRLGAGRVFAFDVRQHWIDQCNFLAKAAPAPQISCRRCELADIPALGLEPFDVTLFSGIFYHLPDPVAGLRIAADLTKELIIVNTAAKPERRAALVLNEESLTHHLSGVHGLAWAPTGPEVVAAILAWCGFEHVRIDLYWTPGRPGGWKRLQMLGARDPATFADYDRRRPDAIAPPTLVRRARRRLRQTARRLARR